MIFLKIKVTIHSRIKKVTVNSNNKITIHGQIKNGSYIR